MVAYIAYINSKNEKVVFGENGIFISDSDLLDYEWDTEKESGKITSLKKDLKPRNFTIKIKGTTHEDAIEKRNRIFEVFERDVLLQKCGKITIGDYYLRCYVIESRKSNYIRKSNFIELKCKIIPEYPFWCKETTQSFMKRVGNATKGLGGRLTYPFSYPYRYSESQEGGRIKNEHYVPCDFKMIIYGPCTDPMILISGHKYEVKCELYNNEYLEIDSRDHTVCRCMNDGTMENKFNHRNKESNIFEKIPSGNSTVWWNAGEFGFDVILFQERSEPKWIL